MFELTVLVRDAQGNVVEDAYGNPKKKTFSADTGYKIYEIWNRNGAQPKKRKSKGGKAKPKDAQKILDEINTVYSEKIKKKKRIANEDDE